MGNIIKILWKYFFITIFLTRVECNILKIILSPYKTPNIVEGTKLKYKFKLWWQLNCNLRKKKQQMVNSLCQHMNIVYSHQYGNLEKYYGSLKTFLFLPKALMKTQEKIWVKINLVRRINRTMFILFMFILYSYCPLSLKSQLLHVEQKLCKTHLIRIQQQNEITKQKVNIHCT